MGSFISTAARLLASVLGLLGSANLLLADENAKTKEPEATSGRTIVDEKIWKLDKANRVDKSLPRVLLIGDAILGGYSRHVIAQLKGKADVDVWINPYNQSKTVNRILSVVLQQGPYDVVHFNVGLHSWPEGRIKPGTFQILTKAYVEVLTYNLPKAKLIWATTTPVTVKDRPTELDPKINPIIVEHNRMAVEVMKEFDIPVNDFYSMLVDKLNLALGDQFKWTPPAYKMLAEKAVASIEQALPKPE